MFALRVTGFIASFSVFRTCTAYPWTWPLRLIYSPIRRLTTENSDFRKMVDPRHVVSYEDMLKVIHQPEKVIIDVRNPEEVNSTGKIPSSINIPLGTVHDALTSMSDEEFKRQYQRPKPSSSDELIFYCQSGRRSTEALDKALKLGYVRYVYFYY
ncbi:rhodanese domain-containing protein CG4456-like [Epargyreus clarus]|uniref:rhodanese domain-containing protein CG4456-like n=1 Tax=Epargyreus clarus TaxID=520877 RepID=UPI003C2F4FE2